MEDVEVDLKNMSLKRWRKRDLDEREWLSLVREAKAKMRGL
jgi:hypothetical protein